MARVRRRWWAVELWKQHYRRVPSGRCLHRPDSQGREAGRLARGAGDESRTVHQSQDRQGAPPHHAHITTGARRRGDRVRRREFITLLGGAAAWPFAAHAQPTTERVRRIGVLMSTTADDPEGQARIAALHQGLQEWGWTLGRNARIDVRWGAFDAVSSRHYATE